MTDLEIIQNIFGSNDVSEKWLINMFAVCKSVREAEREACAQIVHDTYEGFGVNAKGIQYVKQRIIKQIEERRKK